VVVKEGTAYTSTADLAGKTVVAEAGSAGEAAIQGDENLAKADYVSKSVQTDCLMEGCCRYGRRRCAGSDPLDHAVTVRGRTTVTVRSGRRRRRYGRTSYGTGPDGNGYGSVRFRVP